MQTVSRRLVALMICRVRFTFIACFLLAAPSLAQDMSKTVVPITEVKWVGLGAKAGFGTGFCLDSDCRYIGTNYHVAMWARPRKIRGQRIIQRYLATGPDDDGATMNSYLKQGDWASSALFFSANSLKYTLSRDLAIYELRYPIPHYHGIPFNLDDLQIGQQVDIYSYPKESINPIRKLLKFHGAFKAETTGGLLAFDYSPLDGKTIRPGASGGLVVDSKTQQVVGILNAIAGDAENVAIAVPIQSLADFVSKVQPWLAESLFPSANKEAISPAASDLYPEFVPPPPSGVLEHRPNEPVEIGVLRAKAQNLADSIRNFIAVQSFEWGRDNKRPAARAKYEVRVVDKDQQFREFPDGKKELKEAHGPSLDGSTTPGAEWSKLPQMVGTEFRLKVDHPGDVVMNERSVKVFRYFASVEDDLCGFTPIDDYLFFKIQQTVDVACYGEVWTDADTNIIRISEHLDLSQKLKAYRGWEDLQIVITYGWLRRKDESPRLVPLTIFTESRDGKHVYWCRGSFTNYRVFTTQTRIMTNEQKPPTDARPGLPQ